MNNKKESESWVENQELKQGSHCKIMVSTGRMQSRGWRVEAGVEIKHQWLYNQVRKPGPQPQKNKQTNNNSSKTENNNNNYRLAEILAREKVQQPQVSFAKPPLASDTFCLLVFAVTLGW